MRDLLVQYITLHNDQSFSPPGSVTYLSPYFILNWAGHCRQPRVQLCGSDWAWLAQWHLPSTSCLLLAVVSDLFGSSQHPSGPDSCVSWIFPSWCSLEVPEAAPGFEHPLWGAWGRDGAWSLGFLHRVPPWSLYSWFFPSLSLQAAARWLLLLKHSGVSVLWALRNSFGILLVVSPPLCLPAAFPGALPAPSLGPGLPWSPYSCLNHFPAVLSQTPPRSICKSLLRQRCLRSCMHGSASFLGLGGRPGCPLPSGCSLCSLLAIPFAFAAAPAPFSVPPFSVHVPACLVRESELPFCW